MRLLSRLLERFIAVGTLRVIDARGRTHVFSGLPGPSVTMRLHDRALAYQLFLTPKLAVGEAYMDGRLTVEEGTLYDMLDLFARNIEHLETHPVQRIGHRVGWFIRGFQHYNPLWRARSNVAHHYDLSDELYTLFLDADRQYSCAYFQSPEDDLDTAQTHKKHHIAAKLLLEPGMRVLDIGSGWGGLALYLASIADVEVTGITLSQNQYEESNRRAAQAGLSNRVRFHLRDYREETGRYDRIVSVGMFEHVGTRHYPAFFGKVGELLTDRGVALLHSIGRMEPPGTTNPWLRKYIFPGAYAPALSEVTAAVEKVGLWVTDIEILRLHYAETLKEWHRRFQGNREKIREIYDERFCRMWEFYLVGCEVSFRRLSQMVFQMQLARDQAAVPLTRDYVTDWERARPVGTTLAAE